VARSGMRLSPVYLGTEVVTYCGSDPLAFKGPCRPDPDAEHVPSGQPLWVGSGLSVPLPWSLGPQAGTDPNSVAWLSLTSSIGTVHRKVTP